eukprot:CAMPEP_0169397526 /NCGR_PEP_ID=MMETSP1017-20121227/52060_1 /TAXON_ID=342587 /ORGANISM="Karlodinium micrum, Strain CCMP2283" /LENGTH=32 /DNA_ID= /DNA_START= /DNA_END= /DNA_ORIENTATION=
MSQKLCAPVSVTTKNSPAARDCDPSFQSFAAA